MSEEKKILVTGGCGFIGSHTVVALIEAGFSPIIVDSLINAEKFIHDQIEKISVQSVPFYKIDCCDKSELEKIFLKENIKGIVHFAAFKAVGESVQKPTLYYRNNLVSLLNILDLCAKYNVNHFVFSSSCTVYGNPLTIPVFENTPVGKIESPYGNTKKISEEIIHDFVKANTNFKTVLLRYFNPIGSHPSGEIGELPIGVPNNLIPYITQTAIGKRQSLTVFGNDYSTPDGTCVRDYIHVCDLANAHVSALNVISSLNENPCIINLGTGKGNSVLEVIQAFEKINAIKLNYTIGNRREGDVESIYANTEKSEKLLNWKCKFTLAEALQHAWNWEKKIADKK